MPYGIESIGIVMQRYIQGKPFTPDYAATEPGCGKGDIRSPARDQKYTRTIDKDGIPRTETLKPLSTFKKTDI